MTEGEDLVIKYDNNNNNKYFKIHLNSTNFKHVPETQNAQNMDFDATLTSQIPANPEFFVPTQTDFASDDELDKIDTTTLIKNSVATLKSHNETIWDAGMSSALANLFQSPDYEDYQKVAAEVFSKLETTEVGAGPSPLSQDELKLGSFYGLPNKAQELIKQYKGIESLYEWQHECLNLPAIKERKNLVYALPTSGGKTLVSEILILRELLCRRKNVLFVLPYVAIVEEKVWALSPFALSFDFMVEEYAGAKGVYPPRKRRYKNSVYIATMEKALGLVNSLMQFDRLNEIGLVVVDELHLVGEAGRGPTLETLLTKLIYSEEKIQIIGMSATIGNLDEICTFLKADLYTKEFRPVDLKEYVKCGSTIYEINKDFTSSRNLLKTSRIVNYENAPNISKYDNDHIAGLVLEVAPKDSCLVFCSTKRQCENVAMLICQGTPRNILRQHRQAEKARLINEINNEGAICPTLAHTLLYGVAYHHAGLTSNERHLIETAFRNGTVCCICCTSTLAAGVNLPASRVIIRNPNIAQFPITLGQYKQMSGRAGRAGLCRFGESILICNPKTIENVIKMLSSPIEDVESRLLEEDSKGLREMILNCVALGSATTRRTIHEMCACTLLAIQQKKREKCIKKSTDLVISNLFKLGAIQLASTKIATTTIPDQNLTIQLQQTLNQTEQQSEELFSSPNPPPEKKRKTETKQNVVVKNDSRLIVSKLGMAAIKAGLDLDTAHLLYEDLVTAQQDMNLVTDLHLLYLVTPYGVNIKPSLRTYFMLVTELKPEEFDAAKIIGINKKVAASMNNGRLLIKERIANRFYLALVLYDLCNNPNDKNIVTTLENKYNIPRSIIQNLLQSAATFTHNVIRFCEQLEEFYFLVRLLKGLSEKSLRASTKELELLMELPYVKMSRARQLHQAGYDTLQKIAKEDPQILINKIEHLTPRVANQMIASAKLIIIKKIQDLREEAEDVMEGLTASQLEV